jgi:CelD/BcsL family acetyltransferase involved in cellulose biosynthesis
VTVAADLAAAPAAPGTQSIPVTVLRSVDEVEALRPVWQRLHERDLPSDLDYFLTVARHHPDVVRPHVAVVAPRGGEPMLLAAHLARLSVGHKLGGRVPFNPRLRALNVHHGVVGRAEPELVEAGLRAFLGELGGAYDAILLRNLEPGSTLHRVALSVAPRWSIQRWYPVRPRWSTEIGSTPEETFKARSGSTREGTRRIVRRIDGEFGERAVLRRFDKPEDAETLFRDLDAVAVTTKHQRSQPVFRDSELERSLARVGLEKGWYRAYLLYLEDRPVAYWTGFAYGGLFGWRGVTGYDPELRRYGLGRYVLAHLLEDLSRDPDIHRFGLGTGDFPYKRSFGDRRWEVVDVRIFAPTARGRWVNGAGAAVHGVNAVLDRARRRALASRSPRPASS